MKSALATKVFQKFNFFILILCCVHRVLFQFHLMWRVTSLTMKEESSGAMIVGGV